MQVHVQTASQPKSAGIQLGAREKSQQPPPRHAANVAVKSHTRRGNHTQEAKRKGASHKRRGEREKNVLRLGITQEKGRKGEKRFAVGITQEKGRKEDGEEGEKKN
jgi:hypothetical protein